MLAWLLHMGPSSPWAQVPCLEEGRVTGFWSSQERKVSPTCRQRVDAVLCLFAGEVQKQERGESCAAAEALTVPEDAGKPAVSSPTPPSNRNQSSHSPHPWLPQIPSEDVNTVGKEAIQLTDGREAADLEEVTREAPTEEQRCEPGLSPQGRCTTALQQDPLPSMQPEAKASSVDGDHDGGLSEGGDTRSTVQT